MELASPSASNLKFLAFAFGSGLLVLPLSCGDTAGTPSTHDAGKGGTGATSGLAGNATSYPLAGKSGVAGADGTGGTSAAAGADNGTAGSASVTPPSPYSGSWVGTTSSKHDIGFTIADDGRVDSLVLWMSLDAFTATCTGPAIEQAGDFRVDGDAFSAEVAFPGSSVQALVEGTFSADALSASGTFTSLEEDGFALVCGSTASFGTGTLLADGTWTAVRGVLPCEFDRDGVCDEPPAGTGACVRGSDPADCGAGGTGGSPGTGGAGTGGSGGSPFGRGGSPPGGSPGVAGRPGFGGGPPIAGAPGIGGRPGFGGRPGTGGGFGTGGAAGTAGTGGRGVFGGEGGIIGGAGEAPGGAGGA